MAKSIKSSSLKNSGFTLVELITVIGVISILSIIGITALDPTTQFEKSQDARKKSDLNQIQKALESYYEDHGRYPGMVNESGVYYIESVSSEGEAVHWGDSWQPYMNVLPSSPDSTFYIYYVDEDVGGQAYYLYANLSRGEKDPQVCNTDGSPCQSALDFGISTACGGDGCNYGVTSPNVNP